MRMKKKQDRSLLPAQNGKPRLNKSLSEWISKLRSEETGVHPLEERSLKRPIISSGTTTLLGSEWFPPELRRDGCRRVQP